MSRCQHNIVALRTEEDGCFWARCTSCHKRGPKKNTRTLAWIAWAMRLTDQHPRAKRST